MKEHWKHLSIPKNKKPKYLQVVNQNYIENIKFNKSLNLQSSLFIFSWALIGVLVIDSLLLYKILY